MEVASEKGRGTTIFFITDAGMPQSRDSNLHLDGDRFLLLVDVGRLGELDVSGADVAGSRKLDAVLGAGDHDRLTELKVSTGQNFRRFKDGGDSSKNAILK